MLSHEAQCDGIVAVGHDAYFVMPNFVLLLMMSNSQFV